MSPLTRKDATEVYLSFNLFRSVKGTGASKLRSFSIKHRLYSAISNSIAFSLEIPFILEMSKPTKKRGRTYCAYKEETWQKLRDLLDSEHKCDSVDVKEAWNLTIEDLTDPDLNSLPSNSFVARKVDIAQSQFLFDVSTVLRKDDLFLMQLIYDSWELHTALLSEVLVSIDYEKHIEVTEDHLVLQGLPEKVVSAYAEKFTSLTGQAGLIYSDRDEIISKINVLAASYAPDIISDVTTEVLDFLQRKIMLVDTFRASLKKTPSTSVIRVMNQTPMNFLNYPLPPY